jgi:hypothetical protein
VRLSAEVKLFLSTLVTHPATLGYLFYANISFGDPFSLRDEFGLVYQHF